MHSSVKDIGRNLHKNKQVRDERSEDEKVSSEGRRVGILFFSNDRSASLVLKLCFLGVIIYHNT